MKKGLDKLIDKRFKERKNKITIIDISNIVKSSKTDISLINALFSYANFYLDKYTGNQNLFYINKTLEFIKELIVKEDLTKVQNKIEKIVIKLKKLRVENEELFFNNSTIKEKFDKVEQLASEMYGKVKIKQHNQFDLLEYINTKNLDYLEKIFHEFPKLVNCKDQNKNSLFYNIFKHVVLKSSNNELDEKEIIYYNKVLELIKAQSNFNLSPSQQSKCLKELEKCLVNKSKLNIEEIRKLSRLVLSEKNDINFNTSNISSLYKINIKFDKKLADELSLYQTPISKKNYPNRLVLDDYIITIDGSNTVELDDALSIKKTENGNYLLGVHIASPIGYLPFESYNMQEAINRGSTIYLPGKLENSNGPLNKGFIPIFQEKFSTDKASLNEGVSRLARSHFFEIDKNGYVISQKYLKTIIKNNKRCTYGEVNHIIKFGSSNLKLNDTVNMLDEVTYLLEDVYKAKEIYLEKKAQSSDPAQVKMNNSRAEKIVSNAMILTGSNVAEFFANSPHGYPTLYRVHKVENKDLLNLEKELKKASESKNQQKFNELYKALLKIYPAASYDIDGPHEGLNLKHYCHCTSPLRRSADIIVDYSLDRCYFHNPKDKEIKNLEKIILNSKNVINNQNTQIDLFLSDYSKQLKKTKNVN